MDGSGIVAALFETREQADSAAGDLAAHGLEDEQIRVLPVEPCRLLLAEEAMHEEIQGLERGVALGAAVGALIALAAAATGIPGLGDAGLGGYLIGMFGGALFGSLIGGFTGVMLRDRMDDAQERWVELSGDRQGFIVAARTGVHAISAHRVLEHRGGVFLDGHALAQRLSGTEASRLP